MTITDIIYWLGQEQWFYMLHCMVFNKKSIALVFAVTMFVTGCKSSGKLDDIGAPSWVFNPSSLAKSPTEVSAVGIGESSQGGLKVQLAQAEADARGGIANQILSEVARITKDAVRETKVAGADDVEKVFSQATQEVVRDLPLSGTARTNIWQDPKTDVLYVRMVLDGQRVVSHLDDSMAIYDKRLKQSGLDATVDKNSSLISSFSKGIDDRFKDKTTSVAATQSVDSKVSAPIAKVE